MQDLVNKLRRYVERTTTIYPPVIYEDFGISPEEFTELMVKIWPELPNPVVYENRIMTAHENPAKYYEVCDTKYRRGATVLDNQIDTHSLLHQKEDQHISVFRHDKAWLDNVTLTKTVTCTNTIVSPEYIYLELDRDSIDESIEDAIKIYERFPAREAMRFWYSGNRSIHIEVDAQVFGGIIGLQSKISGIGRLVYNLAHKVAGDVRYGNGTADIYTLPINEAKAIYYDTFGLIPDEDIQKVRAKLENIDPNLYRVNSLIRQPWSYHEKTGKQKTLVSVKDMERRDLGPKDKNKLAFLRKKPYICSMLHWAFECSTPKLKPKPKQSFHNENLVVQEFSKHIEGFDPTTANERGYVDGLYSPFYADSNPSVGVNIRTGYYTDFGEPTHFFDFYEFYSRIYDISREDAITKLKNNVDNN